MERPHGIEIFARDGEAIGDFGGRWAEEFGRGDFERLEPGDEEVFGFGFGGVGGVFVVVVVFGLEWGGEGEGGGLMLVLFLSFSFLFISCVR